MDNQIAHLVKELEAANETIRSLEEANRLKDQTIAELKDEISFEEERIRKSVKLLLATKKEGNIHKIRPQVEQTCECLQEGK